LDSLIYNYLRLGVHGLVNPQKLLFLILIFLAHSIFADGYIGIIGSRNEGEHIFETGNKYPNLSGIRGGSRITYQRNFNLGGLEGGYFQNRFSIRGKFLTNGWYQNSGGTRDEDFFLNNTSTEKGSKFSPGQGILHDTAYTYTGTTNFADGKGRSTISEYNAEGFFRYHFGEASPNPWGSGSGYFLSAGLRYSYAKLYVYDVMQYVNSRPIFYGPIGAGLSYSYSFTEIPIGGGYIFSFGDFKIEPSVHILYAFIKTRDFHIQRALNFLAYTSGPGFLARLETSYILSESSLLKIGITGHRHFTVGGFTTRGGLYENDILSNYLGSYRSYINTKEVNFDFSYNYKL
jgi:hypothetical protein